MKKTNITAIIGGILITSLVICIIIAAVPAVCRAGESRNEKLEDEAFREMVNEYKSSLRNYLEEEGYENAGITLTYVSLKEGGRTYTALIHPLPGQGNVFVTAFHQLLQTMQLQGSELLYRHVIRCANGVYRRVHVVRIFKECHRRIPSYNKHK